MSTHRISKIPAFDGSKSISSHPCLDSNGLENTINKKLLVVSHSYNSFQKDSIEASSEYFEEINVLVRTNTFAEISNYLPITRLQHFRKSNKIDLADKPSNTNIIPTPLLYLPRKRSYKSLGEKHLYSVEKVIRQNNLAFDFIHSHFTWSAGYVGARLKERYRVPFVVTAHGYDIYSLPFIDNEWTSKIEYVLNSADRIITVSKSNQACIEKLNVSTPVTVIPNGFKSDLFYPRNPSECRKVLNLPQDKKIILTVGNLEPVKGQKYLIDAVSTIISEGTDVLCIIVGAGRLHNALQSQIHSLGLEGNILLAGGKYHNEIPLWMNACDLFVLPSLNESFGVVQIEAMACGKPLIGTRVGGIPEIITSSEYGRLIDPGDAIALAREILKCLETRWNQKAILRNAEQYTWREVSLKILKLYEQIIK